MGWLKRLVGMKTPYQHSNTYIGEVVTINGVKYVVKLNLLGIWMILRKVEL